MKDLHPNLLNIQAVARALKPLGQDVVFVGGATVMLYADNISLGEIRATEDVDCVVEIASLKDYHKLEEKLRSLGFLNSSDPKTPICRWKLGNLKVDIMPTQKNILGFSNPWYAEGFKNKIVFEIPQSRDSIHLFPISYFLCSKFEALINRGMNDLILSQDFEDIVFLFIRRANLLKELEASEENQRIFLADKSSSLMKHGDFEMALSGCISNSAVKEIVIDKLKRMRALRCS